MKFIFVLKMISNFLSEGIIVEICWEWVLRNILKIASLSPHVELFIRGFSPPKFILTKNLENLWTYEKNFRIKSISNLILYRFSSYQFSCKVNLKLAKAAPKYWAFVTFCRCQFCRNFFWHYFFAEKGEGK